MNISNGAPFNRYRYRVDLVSAILNASSTTSNAFCAVGYRFCFDFVNDFVNDRVCVDAANGFDFSNRCYNFGFDFSNRYCTTSSTICSDSSLSSDCHRVDELVRGLVDSTVAVAPPRVSAAAAAAAAAAAEAAAEKIEASASGEAAALPSISEVEA